MTRIARHADASGLGDALEVRDLGRMAYEPALQLQRKLHQEVIAGRDSDPSNPRLGHLLLVEHDPPVITISRRPDARRNLIATEAQLRAASVQVAETDRGGDITYHGPGQLVVYPILDLNVLGLRLHGYMRFLEQVIIELLVLYGIRAERDASATGVWVRPAPDAHALQRMGVGDERASEQRDGNHRGSAAKICAMGVRISRWVTMHGLALNVTTNLEHFNLIVPCGLTERSVTSLQRELSPRCPTMDRVKTDLIAEFKRELATRVAATPLLVDREAASG